MRATTQEKQTQISHSRDGSAPAREEAEAAHTGTDDRHRY